MHFWIVQRHCQVTRVICRSTALTFVSRLNNRVFLDFRITSFIHTGMNNLAEKCLRV